MVGLLVVIGGARSLFLLGHKCGTIAPKGARWSGSQGLLKVVLWVCVR